MSKKPKTTPWFSGNVKPVRDGVYERDYGGKGEPAHIVFGRFSGGLWMCGDKTAERAALEVCATSFQDEPWRGLAEKPA